MKIAVAYEPICGNTAAVAKPSPRDFALRVTWTCERVGAESFEADMLVAGASHARPRAAVVEDLQGIEAASGWRGQGDPLDYQPTAGIR